MLNDYQCRVFVDTSVLTDLPCVAISYKVYPLNTLSDNGMEVDEKGAAKAEDIKKEEEMEGEKEGEDKDKCPYIQPVRVDINVQVSEIEWTTEVTDEALNTTSDVATETFDTAPYRISRKYVGIRLQYVLV